MTQDRMPTSTGIERLLEIMARLREPDGGCPWDIEQDFATIAPYTIEEAYEVADAIEKGDFAALKDELGDLLFQAVYHAQMADEEKRFNFDDVVDSISTKMIRRHPHVFGDAEIESAEAQTQAWEVQKAKERAAGAQENGDAPSVLDGVALAYPALLRAMKLQNRAARVGFDWPDHRGALEKLKEEIAELEVELDSPNNARAIEDELSDILFSTVNLARKLDIDPEAALRQGNAKFEKRFRWVESAMTEAGAPLESADLDAMELMWQKAKKQAD